MLPDRALSERHLNDLRRSGLKPKTIALAQVYTERDPERVRNLLRWGAEDNPAALGPCLVFPFLDLAGNPTHFYRVKPDKPYFQNGRAAKYLTPRDGGSRLYYTPTVRAHVQDATKPIVITEGEKKALAADQIGCACIGLSGCWNWVRPRTDESTEKQLLEDFDDVALHKRRVYVLFDSDAAYNPSLRRAEWELCCLLQDRGADVLVPRLPARLGGEKVGLDDYLLTHSVKDFSQVLLRAARPSLSYPGFVNEVKVKDADDPSKFVDLPRSCADLAGDLVKSSGGWPKIVGGELVLPDQQFGTRVADNPHQIFAFASEVYEQSGVNRVRWERGPGHVSRAELHEYLVAHCPRYDRADRLPHVPPIPGVLYTSNLEPTVGGATPFLDKFVAFFNPETEEDKTLLIAAMLTPLWGGPPGKRPAFVFQAGDEDTEAGRGVGKTTVAQKIAKLYGGAFDVDASEPFHRTRSRLLTPEATASRVLLMDNVKTFRLSSSDLESLVTSPCINGHRLYSGQAGVPNYYTLFVTVNGASLSKDFAQRSMAVCLRRSAFTPGWEAEVDKFIEEHGDKILADLMSILLRESVPLAKPTRWVDWGAAVMSKLPNADRALEVVAERTGAMDADKEDADRIREVMEKLAATHDRYDDDALEEVDANRRRYLLNSAAITRIIELAMSNRFVTAGAASAQLKSLGMPEFRQSDRNGKMFWLWTGVWVPFNYLAKKRLEYDAEKETWTLHPEEEYRPRRRRELPPKSPG